MRCLYSNVDGLDVTIQGAAPERLLTALLRAKEAAQRQRGEVDFPLPGLSVAVGRTGGAGGYALRLDTGLDGALVFLATNTDPRQYNIRLSWKSLALLTHGYEGVKARKARLLDALRVQGPPEADGQPVELVSRIDVACDFLTDGFTPDLACIVAPSRATRTVNGHLVAPDQWSHVHRGQRLESLRVGTMPGRQVALYDKGAEIKVSGKGYWLAAWGLPADHNGQVWRVEARAGKDALRDAGIVSFTDLDQRGGDLLAGILDRIRYAVPNGDGNPSRWPAAGFWRQAQAQVAAVLACPAQPMAEAAPLCREQKREWFGRQLVAYLGGYAHLSDWPEALDPERLNAAVEALAHEHRDTYRRSYRRARQRYQAAP